MAPAVGAALGDDEGYSLIERPVQLARDTGGLDRLPMLLNQLAAAAVWRGDFAAAAALIDEPDAVREATGALQDLSFDTIAGAAANGAVVHYRPTVQKAKRAELGSLLLVDSGAQYLDGTTDVTRTVAIGEPSAEMRERFEDDGAWTYALARYAGGLT